jgi:hypothetical protein
MQSVSQSVSHPVDMEILGSAAAFVGSVGLTVCHFLAEELPPLVDSYLRSFYLSLCTCLCVYLINAVMSSLRGKLDLDSAWPFAASRQSKNHLCLHGHTCLQCFWAQSADRASLLAQSLSSNPPSCPSELLTMPQALLPRRLHGLAEHFSLL